MQRTRSAHSIHRPLSRASTQSAQSPAPDLLPDNKYHNNAAFMQQQLMGMQYVNPQPTNHMDPMMQMQAQNFQMSQQQFDPNQHYLPDNAYMLPGDTNYPMPPHMMQYQAQLNGSEPEDKRRKGSSATATNDKELRELLSRNDGRSLPEVAQEVIAKERTPQAEKTKQLFAMLWLRKVCKTAKTSVPRNRVYSHYATRCGTERVVPLNPASFGKLVRVIFPGIQTRRLGVRGESKYHYVDLCLVDDAPAEQSQGTARSTPALERADSRRSMSVQHAQIDFSAVPRPTSDNIGLASQDGIMEKLQPSTESESRGPPSHAKLFAYPDTRGMVADNEGSVMYDQILRFPLKDESPSQENEAIILPDLHPFCPLKTDPDTADALVALYRTHCTSLIDCIRFCKEKQFFRLFTSFHGTLTVPVQKLLAHPNLAPWIQAVDTLMYQKMVRFVSRLTLQAAPPAVITILNNISTNLHAHISKIFSSHPVHLLQAKLKPAATFASLLHRLIRVNAAAHAAANLLTIDQNREQMWREWVTMVNPKRVMEAELPTCGYEEVYKILTQDIRGLLEPLASPPFPDNALFSFDNEAYGYAQNSFSNAFSNNLEQSDNPASTENILDRWSTFLSSLPARFPQAKTRVLLHCISAVGTAALRDITIMGGASYQTWWVMKIFVDEMALWLAAMGGFLEHDASAVVPQAEVSPDLRAVDLRTSVGSNNSEMHSRMSSLDPDFSMSMGNQSQSQMIRPSSAHISRPQSAHSMHSYGVSSNRRPLSRAQTSIGNMQIDTHDQAQQQLLGMQMGHRHSFSMPGQAHVPQQPSNLSLHTSVAPDLGDMDDSGIGMSLVDDDALSKFNFTTADLGSQLMSSGEISVSMV
ncbi:hypothetical protein AAFC00_003474 [Neodothiora populina]|uniref:RFX-type winged-helix domain-containing protein n=1 Tax=Neodothiora populina TaxID=2781224 RepID=A0ABR3PEC7_9PEZI